MSVWLLHFAAAPLRRSAWLDALAEHRAPEAATHFILWCTAQTVVLVRQPYFVI
jgi:hypothetical protein